MRFLLAVLLVALAVPSCRHRPHRPQLVTEGEFMAAGYRFVPQDTLAHPVSRGEKDGELVGVIRSKGIPIRVQPIRMGNYSRYSLRLWAAGGARGSAELRSRRQACYAWVRKDGSVSTSETSPATLPEDWVCLVSLEGNIGIMAWNRKNGGRNDKFYAKNLRPGDAVYKVLEMDDPRYHHEGVPLKELRN